MKIVKIKGSLGNQMFGYAFALALAEKTGEEVKLDLTDAGESPALKKMNISLGEASPNQIKKLGELHGGKLPGPLKIFARAFDRKYYCEENCAYKSIDTIAGKSYFDGSWQSPKYFEGLEDVLRLEFTPDDELSASTVELIEKIKSENAVFVGVRRGDYVTDKKLSSFYGVQDAEYYENAMRYIFERTDMPVFYVMTNDREWAENNISAPDFDGKIRFIDVSPSDGGLDEMMLMAACRHAVIPSSAFYFWGAWLAGGKGGDKIVVAPRKWFADGTPDDVVPESLGWVKM